VVDDPVTPDYDAEALPEILCRSELAALLDLTLLELEGLLESIEEQYRVFEIPKRRGGSRRISAPSLILLRCQRRIAAHVLDGIWPHDVACGFVRGRGILENACEHLDQERVLKLDLLDFFGSIPEARIIDLFTSFGFGVGMARDLGRLCCSHGALPQGAATSPALSNLVAFGLDTKLVELAKEQELRFTRYADDLTFSGSDIRPVLIESIDKIVQDEGFCLNTKKTRLLRTRGGRRIVTGISVATDVAKVPRELKRRLRQEVHYVLAYGYLSFADRAKIENPRTYLESLLGQLTFWRWVEPRNPFIERHYDDFAATCAEFRRIADRL